MGRPSAVECGLSGAAMPPLVSKRTTTCPSPQQQRKWKIPKNKKRLSCLAYDLVVTPLHTICDQTNFTTLVVTQDKDKNPRRNSDSISSVGRRDKTRQNIPAAGLCS